MLKRHFRIYRMGIHLELCNSRYRNGIKKQNTFTKLATKLEESQILTSNTKNNQAPKIILKEKDFSKEL